MRFTCNQDINKMKLKGGEKFCELCSHSVIDFTKKLKQDVVKQNTENPNLCGVYTQQQVSSYKIFEASLLLKKYWLKYVAGITILFSNNSAIGQNKEEVQIKQIVINSDTMSVCVKNNKNKRNEPQSCDKLENVDKSLYAQHPKKNKRKLFVSKKFPFVKYKKVYIVGRF